jgi:hypothetical protein
MSVFDLFYVIFYHEINGISIMVHIIAAVFFCAISLFICDTSHANTFITGPTTIGGSSFTPSSKVTLSFATNGTPNNFDGTQYTIKSKHIDGDKKYGTRSDDVKIYWMSAPVGSSVTATSTPTFDFSPWTSMQ